MSPITFAHITDLHLPGEPSRELNGVRPNERIAQVVERILARDPRPDFVVCTGDHIGDHDPNSYQRVVEALAPLTMPVHHVPGNHDIRDAFRTHLLPEVTGPTYQWKEERAGLRLLLLDSLLEGEIRGRLGAEQLDWVEQTLTDHRASSSGSGRVFAFVHHQPCYPGVEWMRDYGIEDGPQLLEILKRHGVEHLFFGHVHQPITMTGSGVVCISAPATGFQFTDANGRDQVVPGSAGLNWVQVEGDQVRVRTEMLF